MTTNHIESLRLGVANREAHVAGAKARAEANPTISTYWVELDRAEWALADMRLQLDDAELAVRMCAFCDDYAVGWVPAPSGPWAYCPNHITTAQVEARAEKEVVA